MGANISVPFVIEAAELNRLLLAMNLVPDVVTRIRFECDSNESEIVFSRYQNALSEWVLESAGS